MTDPIDRLVKEESSNSFFPEGLWGIVNLTNTASPIEVAAKALNERATNLNVLEIKQVTIGSGSETNEIPELAKYTAILLNESDGKKIILIQPSYDKQFSGWAFNIYDVK